jgi:hypothetical protein
MAPMNGPKIIPGNMLSNVPVASAVADPNVLVTHHTNAKFEKAPPKRATV